jgi:hypothetical protein
LSISSISNNESMASVRGKVNAVIGEVNTPIGPEKLADGAVTEAKLASSLFVAKAWVNFDGTLTTDNIRGSGNVSSVTRDSTGRYTINFLNPLPDSNYSVVGSSRLALATIFGINETLMTTTSVQVSTRRMDGSSSVVDVNANYVGVSIFS